jgi:hypothetical protein
VEDEQEEGILVYKLTQAKEKSKDVRNQAGIVADRYDVEFGNIVPPHNTPTPFSLY